MKLFLDDQRKTPVGFERVYNYPEFVSFVEKNGLPDFISFDHDLADEHYKEGAKNNFVNFDYSNVAEKTGYDCAKWLIEYCLKNNLEMCEYDVHSLNICGRHNIVSVLENFKNNYFG